MNINLAKENINNSDKSFQVGDKVESITDYIREKYPAPKGLKLDIRHLFENHYRLNFWGKIKKGVLDDNKIYISKRISLKMEKGQMVFTEYKDCGYNSFYEK